MFAEMILSPLVSNAWIIAVAGALLLAILIGVIGMVRKNVPGKLTAVLGVLRLAAWALFVLILLQPAWVSTSEKANLPELLVLFDRSASMAQEGKLQDVVGHLNGGLGRALKDRFQVRWYAVDGEAVAIEPGEVSDLKATGTTTRLGDSFDTVWKLARAQDRLPSRVLLATDGHDRGGDALESFRRAGVPVDVLAPAVKESSGAATWTVADFQAARRVLQGSETHFRVTIRTSPAPISDRVLTLSLLEEGKKLRDLKLPWKAGQTEETLTLAHRPSKVGSWEYAFQLEGAEKSPPQKRTVQVVDSKYEILVLEDSWRWEYKYLHRLFEEDPSFRFSALLTRGNSGFVQFGSPDRRVQLIGFPQSRAELEGFDVFILGDAQLSRWPSTMAGSISSLVANEGKSLVVIAGPNLGQFAEYPELHGLLPVELTGDAGKPVAGPVEVRLRPEAATSPFFFQVAGEVEKLPPLDQVYPVVRKRAGATVLLEATKQRNPYGPLIVAAEHTVGRGRVLFIATDTMWKWHTLAEKEGPTPHAIFWQQALRALTPVRSGGGGVQVWMTPARTQGSVGRRQTLEAEIQSDRPVPGSKLTAAVVTPSGERWPLAFLPDPARPERYKAEWLPKEPGVYQIQGLLVQEGKTLADHAAQVRIEPEMSEADDRGIDDNLLKRLTTATGGVRIDPDNRDTWPDAPSLGTIPQRTTWDLWGSFALILALCGVLGVDWFTRVFQGLT